MENIENKENFLSSVYYVFPCKINGEINNKKIGKYPFIDNKNNRNTYLKPLIRNDVKEFIKKMDEYKLDFNDEFDLICGDTKLAIKIPEIKILSVLDNDNAFLMIYCNFFKDNEFIDAKICIKNHIKLMKNYYMYDENGIDSKIKIKIDGIEYPLFSKTNDSIEKLLDISFDFNKYNLRFFMQSYYLYVDDNEDKELDEIFKFCDRSCRINEKKYYIDLKYKTFYTNAFVVKTSEYGINICRRYTKERYDEDNKNSDNQDPQGYNWNTGNLKNEYIYEFIIALNYYFRLHKFLNTLGEIDYKVKKKGKEYKALKDKLFEYKRFSSECFFKNVSLLDFSNSMYHNIYDGFDLELLDNEVEAKFQYSLDYIKSKLDEHYRPINAITSATTFIASAALFLLAVIQAFSCITDTNGTIVAMVIAIGLVLIVLVGKIIIDHIKK